MKPFRTFLAAVILAIAISGNSSAKDKWDPIAPADLSRPAQSANEIPDAEILFSRTKLINDNDGCIYTVYRRIKINSPAGVEPSQKLEVSVGDDASLRYLDVRHTKANGEVREFSVKDFAETTVAKSSDGHTKVRVMIVPQLAAGDIIDVRWRIQGDYILAPTFFCQELLPIRDFSFALENPGTRQAVSWYNLPTAKKVNTDNGILITAHDIPAFIEEPFMPPQMDIRGFILVRFVQFQRETYNGWQVESNRLSAAFERNCKPDARITEKAKELTRGLSDPEEKLRALHKYCHEEIVNASYDQGASALKRRKAKEWAKASETIRDKLGTDEEIDFVFAALCAASGFEVRLARCACRDEISDLSIPQGWLFLSKQLVAVRLDKTWRYFSPGEYLMPYATLLWPEEGVQTVVGNATKLENSFIPLTPPEKHQVTRKATLVMQEDGTLEGDVEETFSGIEAGYLRRDLVNESAEEQETNFREKFTKRIASAETSDLKIDHLREPDAPLIVHFHVRLPSVVPVTDTTAVLSPNIFCLGEAPLFPAEKRVYPISFQYAHQLSDEVHISLPANFALKSGDSPLPINAGDGTIVQQTNLSYTGKSRTLHLKRFFWIGKDGGIKFNTAGYQSLKTVFDRIHQDNLHSVILEIKRPNA